MALQNLPLQTKMAEAFLSVDDQPIPLSQALRYLQASGNLQPFIGQILRQYLLEQELAARDSIQVESSLIEQAVIDFRLNNQLTDPKVFQEWLAKNGLDYNGFHNQIVSSFKLEKLKAEITEPKLQEYFIDRKIFLDRVVLSRIIVAEKELAEELRSQIEEGTRFEQLAREYSMTDDRVVNGMMGPVSRGQMPDGLRALVDQASPGELIGPLQIDDRYCLFRLEDFLPASLDGPLQQELQNQLFEQWIGEKMQTMTIKLQVG